MSYEGRLTLDVALTAAPIEDPCDITVFFYGIKFGAKLGLWLVFLWSSAITTAVFAGYIARHTG